MTNPISYGPPPSPTSPLDYKAARGELRMVGGRLMMWNGASWERAVVAPEDQNPAVNGDLAVTGNITATGIVDAVGNVVSRRNLLGYGSASVNDDVLAGRDVKATAAVTAGSFVSAGTDVFAAGLVQGDRVNAASEMRVTGVGSNLYASGATGWFKDLIIDGQRLGGGLMSFRRLTSAGAQTISVDSEIVQQGEYCSFKYRTGHVYRWQSSCLYSNSVDGGRAFIRLRAQAVSLPTATSPQWHIDMVPVLNLGNALKVDAILPTDGLVDGTFYYVCWSVQRINSSAGTLSRQVSGSQPYSASIVDMGT